MRALYRLLMPAERFILDITLAAAAMDAVSLGIKGVGIDVFAYLRLAGLSLVLAGAGLAYRASRRSDRIAAALVCSGLFIGFSLAMATFNYSLLPVWQPPVDVFLAKLDAALGYDWAGTIAFAARHPVASHLLGLIYLSTLAQIALLIVLLGLSGRLGELHLLCVTVTVGATLSVLCWGIFPSIGPSWILPHPSAEELDLARPMLGVSWGETQYRIVTHGIHFLSPLSMQGLIGFPSFHSVLAMALIYFSRKIRWLFPAVAGVNLLVFPALLIHGSHHLVDIPGGLAVFFIALACARRIVRPERQEGTAIGPVVGTGGTAAA